MAHSLDTTVIYPNDGTTTNNGNPVNATITVAANATGLAIGLLYANAANNRTGGAPTAGGVEMTQANVTQKAGTSPEGTVEAWYLPDPPTGNVALAIPNTATLGIKVVAASFIAQANYTSRYDTAAGANGTTGNPTVSVNTSVNGAAVFSVLCHGNANCIANLANDSATNIAKFDLGAWGGGSMYALQANAGTQAMGYTVANDDWGVVALAFKEEAKISGTVNQTVADTTLSATGRTITRFNLSASANIANSAATNTTAQLTAPANKTSNDFGAGKISDDTNPISLDLAANQYTELEWCLSANAAVTTDEVYTFRVTLAGTPVNTYAANATWTIGSSTVNGTVTQTLDASAAEITATVDVAADVQQTLADAGLAAASTVYVAGALAQTLADATLEATGTVADPGVETSGTVEQTIADTAVESTGTVSVSGALDQTLAVVTPAATGTVSVSGTLDQTLAATTLVSTGTTGGVALHAFDTSARFPASANTATAVNPITFSYTAGANATAVAVGLIYAGTTNRAGGAPTIGGVAMTQAATRRGTTEASAEVWYLCAPNVGTATITIPNTGGLTTRVYVASFAAPEGYASLFDAANGANATSANPTSSVTTTTAGDALFAVVASGLNDFPGGTSNQAGTALYVDDIGTWGGGAQYLIRQTTGAQAMGWTSNSDDWGTVSLALKVAASGPVGTVAQTLDPVAATVTARATTFALQASTGIAPEAATATAARLIPPGIKSAGADFQAGRISDDTNPLPSIDLVTGRYTELEWCLRATEAAVSGGTYQFRVTAKGTALTTYSVTPEWLVLQGVSADVTQTLADATGVLTGVVQDAGTADITQTLEDVTAEIEGSTGRAAEVEVTLGSVSQPRLRLTATDLGGGGTPDGWNVYFGRVSGAYTQIIPYPHPDETDVDLIAIAPDVGEWYIQVTAYNSGGESLPSNEVFAVVPTFTVAVTDTSGIADVTQTLGSVSLAAAARVDVTALVVQSLAATAPTAAGTVSVSGVVAQTLQAVTPGITGTVDVAGTIDATLAATAPTATGTVLVSADVTQTLEDTRTTGAYRDADVTATLGDVSQPKLFCDTTDLGSQTLTGFRFYFGQVSGTYTETVEVPYSANLEVDLVGLAPAPGEWYVVVTAYNATGETGVSNEVWVVVPTFTVAVAVAAAVDATLGDAVLDATAAVYGAADDTAWVDALLDDALAEADGTVLVTADVAATLAATGCTAATFAGITFGAFNTLMDGSDVDVR